MKKKDPDNQSHKQTDDLQDYMYAALSVLSQNKAELDGCPDPEDLAAFSEGRLAGDERKAIMAHIKDCPSCRRHWLIIQSTLEEMGIGEATWKDKIIRKLKKLKPHRVFLGGGVGIALAICLLLVFLLPQQDELSKMISKSYMRLSASDIARYNSFVTRGEDQDLESPPSDALSAYKTGLADGRARLLSQAESTDKVVRQEKQLSLLYSMGRWAAVLQCACSPSGSASDSFWADQEAIGVKFQEAIQMAIKSDQRFSSIIQPVSSLTQAIKQIRSSGAAADGCAEIAITLETIENILRVKSQAHERSG